MKNSLRVLGKSLLYGAFLFSCSQPRNSQEQNEALKLNDEKQPILEVNAGELPKGSKTIAVVGARLIDGTGANPVNNSYVIIEGNIIKQVGILTDIKIPADVETVDATGMTLLPGLIDAHFHYDYVKHYPTKTLHNGITSVRDPGQWIEAYNFERNTGNPLPRLFLTGPHLDMPPASWPNDSYIVRDKAEVKQAMDYLIGQGVSAIKIYQRLSLGLIKEVCDIAHAHGIPVTAHLEITDARQAILAGLDGVEHVSSLGVALVSRKRGEAFRQEIMADNDRNKPSRELWRDIDVNSKEADSLVSFLVEHQTFLTPTLGASEYRVEGNKIDSVALIAFENMMGFIAKCHKAGVRIVIGSHGPWVQYAKKGWSYQYEMGLLAKTGMDNMKIIKASTIEAARFLKIDERLGSIEKGKQADLILIEGNPVVDIKDMYNIKKVMLNGVWVE